MGTPGNTRFTDTARSVRGSTSETRVGSLDICWRRWTTDLVWICVLRVPRRCRVIHPHHTDPHTEPTVHRTGFLHDPSRTVETSVSIRREDTFPTTRRKTCREFHPQLWKDIPSNGVDLRTNVVDLRGWSAVGRDLLVWNGKQSIRSRGFQQCSHTFTHTITRTHTYMCIRTI